MAPKSRFQNIPGFLRGWWLQNPDSSILYSKINFPRGWWLQNPDSRIFQDFQGAGGSKIHIPEYSKFFKGLLAPKSRFQNIPGFPRGWRLQNQDSRTGVQHAKVVQKLGSCLKTHIPEYSIWNQEAHRSIFNDFYRFELNLLRESNENDCIGRSRECLR